MFLNHFLHCVPALALSLWAHAAAAQSATTSSGQAYPAKTIRIVVPLAAGGPSDVLTRAMAQKLAEQTGQAVVIDNRPGANTNIGTEFAAKAPADGYTLLSTSSPLTVNPSLYPALPYDPIRDFAPITLIAITPLLLVVHPSLPVKTAKDLIALAKARPAQLHYGSAGNGSALHLAGEMFNGKIVQLQDIRERWATLGAEPAHNTPEQFAAYLKADAAKWAKVVREASVKID